MMNRINAGIVGEPFFRQNVQRPEAGLGDGPAWRPISAHSNARGVFNRLFGLPGIFTEFIRRKAVHRAVPVAVAGKLMPSGLNVPHQMWKALSHPPHNKERTSGVMLIKKIKNALGARYHTRGPMVPAFAVDRPGK